MVLTFIPGGTKFPQIWLDCCLCPVPVGFVIVSADIQKVTRVPQSFIAPLHKDNFIILLLSRVNFHCQNAVSCLNMLDPKPQSSKYPNAKQRSMGCFQDTCENMCHLCSGNWGVRHAEGSARAMWHDKKQSRVSQLSVPRLINPSD